MKEINITKEVTAAAKFFKEKFEEGQAIPAGFYAVPFTAPRGNIFVKVKIDENGSMSGFDLWWDDKFTKSYYLLNKVGGKFYPRS